MLNGDGLRAVLWVAGCCHNCKGCQNPITWDVDGGIPFDVDAEKELLACVSQPHTSGVTFSGGDPLHPANRNGVSQIIQKIKSEFSQKTIWVYTGYLWEEIRELPLMQNVDVLVDGKYIENLRDPKLHWCGSTNQRIIDVKRSLRSSSVILWNDQTAEEIQ